MIDFNQFKTNEKELSNMTKKQLINRVESLEKVWYLAQQQVHELKKELINK